MKKILSFFVLFLLSISQTFALTNEEKKEILTEVWGLNDYLDKVDFNKIHFSIWKADNSLWISVEDDFIKEEYLEGIKTYFATKNNWPTLRKELKWQKILPESLRVQFELSDWKLRAKFLTKKDFVEYKKLRQGSVYPTLESVKEQFPGVSGSVEVKFKETEKTFVEKFVEKIKEEFAWGFAPNPESLILEKDCRVIWVCSEEEMKAQKEKMKKLEEEKIEAKEKRKKFFVPVLKEDPRVRVLK